MSGSWGGGGGPLSQDERRGRQSGGGRRGETCNNLSKGVQEKARAMSTFGHGHQGVLMKSHILYDREGLTEKKGPSSSGGYNSVKQEGAQLGKKRREEAPSRKTPYAGKHLS